MKRLIAIAISLVFVTTLALAHGEATHLLGTVTAASANTVTIKMQNGKSETVMLEKVTKYLSGTKAATAADLKVGTRVMIEATMDEKMKMYTAEEIKIGAANAPAADSKR